MDRNSADKAQLVRQYELLLVQRHRFVMADAVASILAVVSTLRDAESLLQSALQSRDTSGHSGASMGSRPPQQRHHQRKATYTEVMEGIAARLAHLTTQIPVFLGDSDLLAFVRELRDFTQHPDLELFWDLHMTTQEKRVADKLTNGVVKTLETQLLTLESAVTDALPIACALRKKRDHLIQVVDESLELLEKARTAQSEQFEKKKKRLLVRFQDALQDPTLQELHQLEHEIQSIEREMLAMLQPHIEICRTVTTANAQVPNEGEFSDSERSEINQFVELALQVADEHVAFSSRLADSTAFLRRLQLFEKAAKTDAFRVWRSALKLNFDEPLDDELFGAYLTDWTGKKAEHRELMASNQYAEATQQVSQLKEQILQAHAAAQSSRQNVVLDGPIKEKLSAQIAQVFFEEGGDPTQVTDVLK